jgi:hypothetical protein
LWTWIEERGVVSVFFFFFAGWWSKSFEAKEGGGCGLEGLDCQNLEGLQNVPVRRDALQLGWFHRHPSELLRRV